MFIFVEQNRHLNQCKDHLYEYRRKYCDTLTEYESTLEEFIGKYRQISNIRRAFVGNQIVDHSDLVGASPVGAAPTTSSFWT